MMKRALVLLLHKQIESDPSNATSHVETLGSIVLAMQDDSSEIRRWALSALKAVSKANPSAIAIHVSKYGPVLANYLKDGNTPVRLAAERCAFHAFQLSKGSENVQAAQKFITGLDARRIAKLSLITVMIAEIATMIPQVADELFLFDCAADFFHEKYFLLKVGEADVRRVKACFEILYLQ